LSIVGEMIFLYSIKELFGVFDGMIVRIFFSLGVGISFLLGIMTPLAVR
jgi:hypothetical protein